MLKLVRGIVLWTALTAAIVVLGWFAHNNLQQRRNPEQAIARQLLEQRLATGLDSADRKTMIAALNRDPLLAVASVVDAQQQNLPGRTAIQSLHDVAAGQAAARARIQKAALQAALDGRLSKQVAMEFTDASVELIDSLQTAPYDELKAEARRRLDGLETDFSVNEYRNVAADPSYLLIAPRLDGPRRAIFRDHQEILTPLLVCAEPSQWNEIVDKFQQAGPERLEKLERDPNAGASYARVVLLSFDLLDQLQASVTDQRQAIQFIAVNGGIIREAQHARSTFGSDWVNNVARLTRLKTATGESLWSLALNDPAIIGVMASDPSDQCQLSLQVLQRYGQTELPAVLMKYRESDKLYKTALQSVTQFDVNPSDDEKHSKPKDHSSGSQAGPAAKFLSHYQDNDGFKTLLAKHGPVLIPALANGGQDSLEQITKNPHDLYKLVDENGKLKTAPLWTWLPGGQVAYAFREKASGRTVSWGELGWAAVDVVLFIPVAGEVAIGAKAALVTERTAGKALLEASADAVTREAAEVLASSGEKTLGREVGELGAKEAARLGALSQARYLLESAGMRAVKAAAYTASRVGALAMRNKSATLILAGAALMAIYPKQTGEWLGALLAGTTQGISRASAAAAAHSIDEIWNQWEQLRKAHPVLGWLYWPLLAAIYLLVICLPILLLKTLLKPVYLYLTGAASLLWWPIKRLLPARAKTAVAT